MKLGVDLLSLPTPHLTTCPPARQPAPAPNALLVHIRKGNSSPEAQYLVREHGLEIRTQAEFQPPLVPSAGGRRFPSSVGGWSTAQLGGVLSPQAALP